MISKSNHVKFARFVLLGVSEEAKKITSIFSVQCIIKQLLDSVFVIFRIIEVSVRVISLSLRLRLITPTSTSIILDITKTSSNNCLICISYYTSANQFALKQSNVLTVQLVFFLSLQLLEIKTHYTESTYPHNCYHYQFYTHHCIGIGSCPAFLYRPSRSCKI